VAVKPGTPRPLIDDQRLLRHLHRRAGSTRRLISQRVPTEPHGGEGHLAACDQTRRNDLDSRGHLSEENLAEFTKFFLTTCIDQVSFTESLIQPDHLRARILTWAEEEIRLNHLPPKSGEVLQAVLSRGELPRADAPGIVGTGERQARRIVSALLDLGVLVSESTRAPLRLAFPAALAPRWMPGLFPERTG